MAPRPSTHVPDPPVSSSSEEEEEEEEEEISSGDEEEEEVDEQIQRTQKREPETAKAAGKEKAKSASESETESEDENVEPIASSKPIDQGTPPKSVKPKSKASTSTVVSRKKGTTKRSSEVENENVEPIAASKPMDQDTPSKRVKPKSKASTSTVVSRKGATKRSSEVEKDAKDSKRAKKMKESKSNGALDKSEDTKKPPFQRVWSEDDEVVLLKGMIDFGREKGVDPTKDMTAYYDFIIKSLHVVDVDLKKFRDKIWKLKQKFENHAKTVEKGSKILSTQHDQTIFDLSKELWGRKVISGTSKPSREKIESGVGAEEEEEAEKEMENHVSSNEIPKLYRGVGISAMENFVIKRGLEMHEGTEKLEIEEKWAKLHMDELELFIRRNELILEQAKRLLAGYKSV